MKFMQIHPFSELYLNEFYAKIPGLAEQPYQKQMGLLADDGYGAAHLFVRPLAALGHETQLVVANCAPAQVGWAVENGIKEIDRANWQHQIVAAQIELFRPDVLYINDSISFDSKFIRALTFRPQVIIGWQESLFGQGSDFSEFDLLLSNSKSVRELLARSGAKVVEHFAPGFPEFLRKRTQAIVPEVDVMFAGRLEYSEYRRRATLLTQVGKAPLGWGGDFSIAYYISGVERAQLPGAIAMYDRGPVWGVEMHRAVKRARIGLHIAGDSANSEAGNMRQFEVCGTGALLLTDAHPSLATYFTPGREVETFKGPEDLLEKIYHYLKNADEREAIAARGQERCLREHGMKTRADELVALIKRCFSGRVSAQLFDVQPLKAMIPEVAPTPAGVEKKSQLIKPGSDSALQVQEVDEQINKSTPALETLYHKASALFSEGRYDEAFGLLTEARKIGGSFPGLAMLRARCFFQMHRYDDALSALNEELQHYPQSIEANELLLIFSAAQAGTQVSTSKHSAI